MNAAACYFQINTDHLAFFILNLSKPAPYSTEQNYVLHKHNCPVISQPIPASVISDDTPIPRSQEIPSGCQVPMVPASLDGQPKRPKTKIIRLTSQIFFFIMCRNLCGHSDFRSYVIVMLNVFICVPSFHHGANNHFANAVAFWYSLEMQGCAAAYRRFPTQQKCRKPGTPFAWNKLPMMTSIMLELRFSV